MTPFSVGKNHILDGSDSGSATVGQLEIFTLTQQPKIGVLFMFNQCDKKIISEYMYIVQNLIVSFLIMRSSHVHSMVQVTL